MSAVYIAHVVLTLDRPRTHIRIEYEKYPVTLSDDGSITPEQKDKVIRSLYRENCKRMKQTINMDKLYTFKMALKIISYKFSSRIIN
jgi:hypothetical protein